VRLDCIGRYKSRTAALGAILVARRAVGQLYQREPGLPAEQAQTVAQVLEKGAHGRVTETERRLFRRRRGTLGRV
jgi:hypothetical protein